MQPSKAYQGSFSEGEELLKFQYLMRDQYEYGLSRAVIHLQTTEALILRRRLSQAQAEANNLISVSRQIAYQTHELQGHGWMAVAQVLARDTERAKESLDQAENIRRSLIHWPPWFECPYLLGQFMHDLQLLKDVIGGDF